MTTAVLQLIMIDEMVKIEFKITDDDGYSRLIEKIIKNEKEFEEFKNEINTKIESLDLIIKQVLKHKSNENTNGNTTADSKLFRDIAIQVQRTDL